MNHVRGFTLIELAIVLVIITFLIGGLAMPLSAQIQARRIAETNRTLEEAREAITGYAITHSCSCAYDNVGLAGILLPPPQTTCAPSACPPSNPSSSNTTLKHPYLPCPDTNNDGKEDRTGAACNSQIGLFPWVELATAAQDAWGNRLRYAVAGDLADSTKGIHNTSSVTGNQISSSIAKCADLDVDVARNVPIVLLSHGSNGRGARNINIPQSSATPPPPPEIGADELQNLGSVQSACTANNFVSNSPSENFDDVLTWISFPQLISRVCPAGGCP